MTIDVATPSGFALPRPRSGRVLAIALRELRGGLAGFHVFIACIALGVAVIAGVGALADALRAGFERQGATLLGGDVALTRSHRQAEPAERDWLRAYGRVSETATLRAMARRLDGSEQILVELKGADAAYPLTGTLAVRGGMSLGSAVAGGGAAVEEILLERLQVKVGDRILVGRREVEIRGVIASEPDKISDRLTFGPRVLIDLSTLKETGLIEPGSLVRWRYAVLLGGNRDAAALLAFRAAVKRDLPDSGFNVADRRDPSPQVTRTLERLRQFLTLVGLTSLLVGGVGVANAVATYIDRRRRVIATFKSLGASSRQIFVLHLAQVLLMAAIGVAAGLAAGLLLPLMIEPLLGAALPVRAEFAIRPASLLVAVAYGLLVALLFALWPLGRAREIRAGVLFRDEVSAAATRPGWPIVLATFGVGALLLLLAVATSEAQRLALYFCLALAGIFALFLGFGLALTALARRTPRPRHPELALALAGIGAPGGLTRSVVISLGSGLSLLVAVALVDASIVEELRGRLPKSSPNFFVLDIPAAEVAGFERLVEREATGAHINRAPMLRGRFVSLAGRPVETLRPPPQAQWVLTGDRGLTYSDVVPEGSRVVAGSWWPKDYSGEPLVSFEAELARHLGLKLGDAVTVNVLGRNVTARIANLRDVHWESLAINFVVVFSPNTLRGAPHNFLATISLPKATPVAAEGALARAIGKAYPAVTAIRVKDAINSFNEVFSRIMVAVRAAGSVTLLAGALVLAGALATAQRRRIKQAVILKVLGGTRRRIVAIHVLEYGMLALATSLLALAVGGLAAWLVLTRVMDVPFMFSWRAATQAVALALGLVLTLGALGTWRVLKAPAVPYLRAE
jgi:putative ABC transport system permease protein